MRTGIFKQGSPHNVQTVEKIGLPVLPALNSGASPGADGVMIASKSLKNEPK